MKQYEIEELAAIQHQIWADWMTYLFSRCDHDLPIVLSALEPGSCIIPASLVKRWKRQIETHYNDLSEDEKEGDRRQVRRFEQLL